jgi:hypothetical protein
MSEEKNVEKVYLESVGKLRACLPKFIIFLGVAAIIWLISTTYFIPLSRGVFVGAIEAARLDSILILTMVIIFLIASFLEIGHVADACTGLILSYIVHKENNIDSIRFRKMRRAFRTTFYIIPFCVAFFIFGNFLEQIDPLFNTIIPIAIVIWAVVAAVLLTMVLGAELEESARAFVEAIEKMRKKKS